MGRMGNVLMAGLAASLPDLARSEAVRVPSGQQIIFQEVVRDMQGEAGLTLRFRFVAPGVATDPDGAAYDMQALCDDYVVPRVPNIGPRPSQIVISLAERAIAFGDSDPGIVQFFEAYRIENGHCVWEAF